MNTIREVLTDHFLTMLKNQGLQADADANTDRKLFDIEAEGRIIFYIPHGTNYRILITRDATLALLRDPPYRNDSRSTHRHTINPITHVPVHEPDSIDRFEAALLHEIQAERETIALKSSTR